MRAVPSAGPDSPRHSRDSMASTKPSNPTARDATGAYLRSADYLGRGLHQPEELLQALRAAQTKGSICFDAVKRKSRSRSILSTRRAYQGAHTEDSTQQGCDPEALHHGTSDLSGLRMEAFAKDVMETELVELYAVLHHNANGSRPNTNYRGKQPLPRLGSRKRPRPATTQEGVHACKPVGPVGNQANDPPAACPARPSTFSGPLPGLRHYSSETPETRQGEVAEWASGGGMLELRRVPSAPVREAAHHPPASPSHAPFGSRGHCVSRPASSRSSASRPSTCSGGVVGLLGSEHLRELRARGYLPPGTSIDALQHQHEALLLPVRQWQEEGEEGGDVDLASPLAQTLQPFIEPELRLADLFDQRTPPQGHTNTQRASPSQDGSRARPSTTAGSSLSDPAVHSRGRRPGTTGPAATTHRDTDTSTAPALHQRALAKPRHKAPVEAREDGAAPRRGQPQEAGPAEELRQEAYKLDRQVRQTERDALAMQHHVDRQVERMKEEFEKHMQHLIAIKQRQLSSPRKGKSEGVSDKRAALKVMERASQRRRLATLYMAMGKWKVLAQTLKQQQEHCAALRLQACTRGWLGRRRVSKLRQQRLKREKRRLALLAKKIEKGQKAALSIQRIVRGHLSRRRARQARLELKTCRAIQAYLRRIIVKRAAWQRIRRLKHADELATCIQSAYRRHLAQRYTARLRRRRRYEAIDRGLSVYKTAVATAFKFNGAAIRIQKWWHHNPYRFRLLVQRAQTKRRRCVRLIQGYIRVFLAKRAAKYLREHRARLLGAPEASVVDDLLATRRDSGPTSALTRFNFTTLALGATTRRPSPDKLTGPRAAKITLPTDLAGGLSALSASVLKGVASLRPVPVSLQLSPVTLTDRVVALLSPKRDEQRRQRIRALAAVRIQKVYRGWLGREAAASARQAKAIKGSMVLPTVLLRPSNRERKRRHRAAWIINANVSKWVRRRQKLNAAAVEIQRSWRGCVCRGAYKVLRQHARRGAVLVQAVARGFLTRQHLQQKCQRLRVRRETLLAGQGLYAATVEHEKRRQLLQGARVPDVGAMLELQRLFLYYTAAQGRFALQRKGGKDEPALLECSRFVRFCNAMSGLLSRDLTARHVEKLFDDVLSESSAGNGRAMEYADFITLIQHIANARLPKLDRFGRFVGEEARFAKLLLENILPAPTSKRILERLDKAQTYPARSKAKVLQSICIIQRVWRGSVSRSKVSKVRDSAWYMIRQRKGHGAAITIQCAFRRHNARRIVCARANEVYVKHEAVGSKAVSFYNPRTGRLLTKVPRLFFKRDYGLAVPEPDPDRAVTLNCNICEWQAAVVYCVECGDYYCGAHFLRGHRKGKAALHPTLPTDLCAHCSSLVGSRYCKRCDDKFCDTCFIALHRRGQLAHHPYEWLTPECAVCHNYMARRVCDTCDGIMVCIPCADEQHQVYNGHNVRELHYRPRAIRQHEAALSKDREARAVEELFRQRMAFIREQKQHRAAVMIQKHWRGYSARKPVAHLLGWARRKFRELDDVTRNSLCYKILEWWGLAPELSSDSTKERVLKRFPHWARALVTDCVDGDWATSLAMILEKEQWAKDRQKALDDLTLKDLLHEEMGAWLLEPLQLAALRARLLKMDLQRGALDKELKVAQHHVSKATKKHEREDAKREVKLVRGEIASLEGERQAVLAKVEQIHAAQAARKGPDRLNQRVQDFKHYGRALPILLDTKQAVPVFRCAKAKAISLLQQGARYRVGHDQRQAGIYVVHRVKQRRRGKAQYAVLHVDRDWMDAGEHGVPIFRLPKLPFHEHLAYRLSYALQQTWVVQSPVALAMGSAHYLAQWLSTLAANLDEDSRLRGRLTWAADQLRLWRDSLARRYRMRYLRLADQLRVRAVLEQAQAWLGGVEKAAARKLKQIQDARRPRDPYEQWEESLDKRDVTVVWRRDEGEGGTDEVLGVIKVDVDMPISILRQKIRRRLREPLNARNGEGFIFLKKEEPLPVFYEERQRGTDVVMNKMDEASKEHCTLCLIFRDPDRPFAEVPFMEDYVPLAERAPVVKAKRASTEPDDNEDDKDDYWAV